MSQDVWMVRAGRNASDLDSFLDDGLIAMGSTWLGGAMGDLSPSRKQLVEQIAKDRPKWSKVKVSIDAGQLFRFLRELGIGDVVATYDPGRRRYWIGRVDSEPRFDRSGNERHPYRRSVTWTGRASRDALSVPTRNTLGAILTIFRLGEKASTELLAAAVGIDAPEGLEPVEATPPAVGEAGLGEMRAEVVEKSSELIEDLIASIDPDQMEELVAGILRAMGYKTRVSPKGADRGLDIFASPDGLGFQEPRIFVEVKHRPGTTMGSQSLRSFLGGRQSGDRCLYVSTGGFTKDAQYEADRSNVPLTLIGLPELRELLVEHYEALDLETKQLVPLTRLYWPAVGD